jgi:phospho-N-acetylmuramoyl-pentapeptide-transferase
VNAEQLSPQLLSVVVPALAAFALTVAVFPGYIRWLKRKQIGQFIREEGPQSHAVKAKTPTMGGLCFIVTFGLIAGGLLLCNELGLQWLPKMEASQGGLAVILIGVCCGLVGFADDLSKVKGQSNAGLSAKSRLLMEFGLGLALGGILYYLSVSGMHDAATLITKYDQAGTPATRTFNLNEIAGWLVIPYLVAFVPFLVAATTNAINLHDGMDGLAGGTSFLVFGTMAIMLAWSGEYQFAVVASAVAGALLAFLVYNRYPAKVFMGDTGSLFLGGLMASLVAAGGLVLWFIPLALIYIVETLSVIMQVGYFRLTKEYKPDPPMSTPKLIITKLTKRLPGEGKRLFKMAPIHHHFEAIAEEKGQPEWHVVAYFWLAQAAICACVLVAFFI